ncbi:MAG: acyl-CoA/acyl-ACP dehydrogenase [Frankiaceae bacterium]|nr:acyl-CoA/acyl-ACP dehydrogenase [Frankiaceae bacterium]
MTPDQESLVGLADQILRGRTSNERLAEVEASDRRSDDRLWAELAAAGLVGIAVPEEYGGAGLGLTDICLLLEQHGRRLALLPLWENAVAALAVARFGTDEQQRTWLPDAAAGTARLTLVADLGGGSGAVPSGMQADAAVVVSADDTVSLVALQGLARTPVETTTHALAADVELAGAAAQPLDGDADWLRDVARVGLAAGQLGNTDEGVREAASYLSQREQFGRPLAAFQAVSQQLGDAYCDVQAMRATLWQAVWALEQGGDARREVDVAAWWACDAGLRVQTAVQHLHGGIGADTTYPVHRRLLWALRTDALLGGASRQLARLGPALV